MIYEFKIEVDCNEEEAAYLEGRLKETVTNVGHKPRSIGRQTFSRNFEVMAVNTKTKKLETHKVEAADHKEAADTVDKDPNLVVIPLPRVIP